MWPQLEGAVDRALEKPYLKERKEWAEEGHQGLGLPKAPGRFCLDSNQTDGHTAKHSEGSIENGFDFGIVKN